MSPKPVTEAFWAGLRPRKHLQLSEKPGTGASCLGGMAATRQTQGANPGSAAQCSKYHCSGAAFFTTAGLTSYMYLPLVTAMLFYPNASVLLLQN